MLLDAAVTLTGLLVQFTLKPLTALLHVNPVKITVWLPVLVNDPPLPEDCQVPLGLAVKDGLEAVGAPVPVLQVTVGFICVPTVVVDGTPVQVGKITLMLPQAVAAISVVPHLTPDTVIFLLPAVVVPI